VRRVPGRFGYARLPRRHKVVVRYLQYTSGYSHQHLGRLIERFVSRAPLGQRRGPVASQAAAHGPPPARPPFVSSS